jgi:hypothetical protein
MFFGKKVQAHWVVIVPSLVVLCALVSVFAVIVIFAGRASKNTVFKKQQTPAQVESQYASNMRALQREVADSSETGAALHARVEEAFFSGRIRVPAERRDAHLDAVIQLNALKRALPTMDDASVRERVLEILTPLL